MQEQMGNVSREMEILRKNNNKNARDKKNKNQKPTTVTEMRNAFDGLISSLAITEERLSKLELLSIESSKPKKPKEQRL